MRLLVTRPEPEAGETAAILTARGHAVLVDPLLRIVFAEPPTGLPGPAAVILTSRNGLRALLGWPQAAGWTSATVFAAGEATAAAARAAGFTRVRAGGGDAASLADTIIAEQPRDGGPLLYPAARDRAGALSAGLLARGYDVRTVEAYRAEPAGAFRPEVREALARRSVDGVLLYSRRTAETFARLVETGGLASAVDGLRVYALSEAVAGPVRRIAGVAIAVADAARQDRLLALIGQGDVLDRD